MNTIRAAHGFRGLDPSEYAKLIGLPALNLLGDLGIDYESKVRILEEFRSALRQRILERVTLFPGVLELLRRMSLANVEIGIATSKPTDLATFTVLNSGLSSFHFVVQGTDDFEAKPNPEVILRCMKRMSGKRFTMVGDRVEDMQAAKSAGIAAIGIAQTTHSQENLKSAGAIMTFKGISEMLTREELFIS
jgi:phosphoglycolate phosphatase